MLGLWSLLPPGLVLSKAVKPTPKAKPGQALIADEDLTVDLLREDPRWQLAEEVATGPHFSRSPLLSRFLLYVVAETLRGHEDAITEHKIGVAVFGRAETYRTDEDNIVRNYARQMRKRLGDHFNNPGKAHDLRIEIPVGRYVPSFLIQSPQSLGSPEASPPTPQASSFEEEPLHSSTLIETWIGIAVRSLSRRNVRTLIPVLIAIAVLISAWLIASHKYVSHAASTDRILWRTLLPSDGTTYVIPPDAGFNLLEDMSHRSQPLASYIHGVYSEASLDEQASKDLRNEQYTDFGSLQIVTALARQPEYDPQRVQLRFPRDLKLNDLKTANAVIIGSATANPWASIAEANTNFRIVTSDDMEGAKIVNLQPARGELKQYESHWSEPAHETYALVVFVPNLSGNGHLLALEGLDAAGTQAAADLLFHPDAIASILNQARRPDGSLRPFEILLRATSLQSDPAGLQVLAARLH